MSSTILFIDVFMVIGITLGLAGPPSLVLQS